MGDMEDYWNSVHHQKPEAELSWFQLLPSASLALIEHAGVPDTGSLIDIGGGTSRLVDRLLAQGYGDITVLDVSERALAVTRSRLAPKIAASVHWVCADITRWQPSRAFDLWHDRAVFHFLVKAEDRAAYCKALEIGLKPGGHLVIGTFALDGPNRCSGLPVRRYSAEMLQRELGDTYELVETCEDEHHTPGGTLQHFQFSRFVKRD